MFVRHTVQTDMRYGKEEICILLVEVHGTQFEILGFDMTKTLCLYLERKGKLDIA